MPKVTGIAFSRSGRSSDKPPLVLVHGSGGSCFDWPPSLRRLAGYRVLAVDLPGHGSSSPPGRDSVREYAAAVSDLLGALTVERAVIAGHSLGGAIALQMSLSFADKVCGLILVGTGARLRVHPDILSSILADPSRAAELIIAWAYSHTAAQRLREANLSRLLRADARVLWGDYTACDGFDVMTELSAITAPALVIVGAEDVMTPVKFSEYLVRNLRDAESHVIPGAGHMVALEQPELVTRTIARWLDAKYPNTAG